MCTLPIFMDAVLSEERQLMKWVELLWVGIFGGIFSMAELDGWEFSRRKFY